MTTQPACNALRSRGALLAVMFALPLPAAAETLYKCVDAAGVTTIQHEPCAKGSKQVWARDSTPETPEQIAAAEARAAQLARDRADMRAELDARMAPPPPPPPPPAAEAPAVAVSDAATKPADPCEEAKTFVAQVRDKPWLGLDSGQTQRLLRWMMQQCGARSE